MKAVPPDSVVHSQAEKNMASFSLKFQYMRKGTDKKEQGNDKQP